MLLMDSIFTQTRMQTNIALVILSLFTKISNFTILKKIFINIFISIKIMENKKIAFLNVRFVTLLQIAPNAMKVKIIIYSL